MYVHQLQTKASYFLGIHVKWLDDGWFKIFHDLLQDYKTHKESTPKGHGIDLPLKGAVGFTKFKVTKVSKVS